MRELLRAVAGLSGVELPGLPPGLQDDDANPPSLDIRSLKDRIRNDLEGFSIKTTQELTKRAREQAHAALDGFQNEVGDSIEKVAAEFRENLLLPAQIEKLLVPCVEDAEARLERSIAQKFEHLVAQHEQSVQDRLQAALSSFRTQMSTLEQTVQQVRELQSEAVAQPSAEQSSAAEVAGRIDQLAAEFREKLQDPARIEQLLEPRVGEAAARLEKSICQKVEHLVAQHEQLVQEKLQGTLSSVQTQLSTLEQTVQQVRDLQSEAVAQPSVEQPMATADVEHLLAEHDRSVQDRLQAALNSVQVQMSTLEQTVQQVRDLQSEAVVQPSAEQPMATADVEHLLAEHEQSVQDRLQAALSSFQTQMSTLEQTVQQVRDLQSEAVVQPSVAQPTAAEVAGRIDQLAAEFRERLQDPAQIEQLLEPRVGEAAARLEKSICQKVEHLVARHEQLVQEKLQGTLSSVRAQMSALEQTVQQIGGLKAEPVSKLPAEQPVAAADITMNEDESSLNKGLKGFLDQAFSRIELSFNNVPQTSGMQPLHTPVAVLGEQREAIPFIDMDREARIQKALDHLGQLGSKDPYPAS